MSAEPHAAGAQAGGSATGSATTDKLVHMANQISRYFASQPRGDAVADVTDHILKFWEPRMRRQALAHLAAGGAGLEPVALAALERVGDLS